LRIIALLDRSVKRVHVDMDDFSHNLPATILFWVPEPGNFYQADRQPSLLQILGIHVATLALNFYSALAISVLFLHALSILWIVFGALLTRSRPIFRWLHIGSLVWGILTELLPWPCPLTLLENWLESNAGVEPYRGGLLLHYLDKLVYPDISATVLTGCRDNHLRSESWVLRPANVLPDAVGVTTTTFFLSWTSSAVVA